MSRSPFAHLGGPMPRASAEENGDLAPDQERLPCRVCDGDGAAPEGELGYCTNCNGSGDEAAKPCAQCDGEGETSTGKDCPKCDGEGKVYEDGSAYTGDDKVTAFAAQHRRAMAKVRSPVRSATAVPTTPAKPPRAAASARKPTSFGAQMKAALAKVGR